mmetsp:Transcript_42668/g.121649  ORF Transcript_42668/g.121649 Transcript_42668/m.121649 type:complete len:209 (-) Transcript_42668:524-1150(-)
MRPICRWWAGIVNHRLSPMVSSAGKHAVEAAADGAPASQSTSASAAAPDGSVGSVAVARSTVSARSRAAGAALPVLAARPTYRAFFGVCRSLSQRRSCSRSGAPRLMSCCRMLSTWSSATSSSVSSASRFRGSCASTCLGAGAWTRRSAATPAVDAFWPEATLPRESTSCHLSAGTVLPATPLSVLPSSPLPASPASAASGKEGSVND